METKIKKRTKEIRDEIYPQYIDYDIHFGFGEIKNMIIEAIELREIIGIYNENKKTYTRTEQDYGVIKEAEPKKKDLIYVKSKINDRKR